jgi:hypothetical protein
MTAKAVEQRPLGSADAVCMFCGHSTCTPGQLQDTLGPASLNAPCPSERASLVLPITRRARVQNVVIVGALLCFLGMQAQVARLRRQAARAPAAQPAASGGAAVSK